MKYIQAFFMSLGMFSAIPCPYRPWNEKARPLMLVALPFVGLVIGLLWYGLFLLLCRISVPLQLQAAVLMVYPYVVTGFIHLDGFMDTSDAILSRRPLEEKLRILKDPHTGAFAVISTAILFILCFASMLSVTEQIHFKQALDIAQGDPMLSLILIPVVSRCGSALAVLGIKPLGHSQYKAEPGAKKEIGKIAIVTIFVLASFLAAALLGAGALPLEATPSVLIVLGGTAAAYLVAIASSVRHLKGVSGDLAGYSLIVAEAAGLIVLALVG